MADSPDASMGDLRGTSPESLPALEGPDGFLEPSSRECAAVADTVTPESLGLTQDELTSLCYGAAFCAKNIDRGFKFGGPSSETTTDDERTNDVPNVRPPPRLMTMAPPDTTAETESEATNDVFDVRPPSPPKGATAEAGPPCPAPSDESTTSETDGSIAHGVSSAGAGAGTGAGAGASGSGGGGTEVRPPAVAAPGDLEPGYKYHPETDEVPGFVSFRRTGVKKAGGVPTASHDTLKLDRKRPLFIGREKALAEIQAEIECVDGITYSPGDTLRSRVMSGTGATLVVEFKRAFTAPGVFVTGFYMSMFPKKGGKPPTNSLSKCVPNPEWTPDIQAKHEEKVAAEKREDRKVKLRSAMARAAVKAHIGQRGIEKVVRHHSSSKPRTKPKPKDPQCVVHSVMWEQLEFSMAPRPVFNQSRYSIGTYFRMTFHNNPSRYGVEVPDVTSS